MTNWITTTALATSIALGAGGVTFAQTADTDAPPAAGTPAEAASGASDQESPATGTDAPAAAEAGSAGSETDAAPGADQQQDAPQQGGQSIEPLAAPAGEAAASEAPAAGADGSAAPAPGDASAATGGEAAPAPADGEPQIGAYYVRSSHEAWTLRCIRTEDQADPCELYQLLRDGSGNSVAEMTLIPLPEGSEAATGATLVAPLETDLLFGLRMRVDSGEPKGYPFNFCAPVGCVSRIGFTEGELNTLKRGGAATIALLPFGGNDGEDIVELEMSLLGFTAGYTALEEAIAEMVTAQRAAAEAGDAAPTDGADAATDDAAAADTAASPDAGAEAAGADGAAADEGTGSGEAASASEGAEGGPAEGADAEADATGAEAAGEGESEAAEAPDATSN